MYKLGCGAVFACAALAGSGLAHAVQGASASASRAERDQPLRLAYSLSEPAAPASHGEENASGPALHFAGYAKALLISSKNQDPAAEPYTLSVNRLRLKLTYEASSHLQVHIEHDTEIRMGNYLGTAAFQREKSAPARQYWHDGSVFADRQNYYGSQHLFRAYARVSMGAADLTIGRQRIPLGTGRIWSALDMLNPVNPLQVERDEYVGVDAALLEYKSGALSKFAFVYAPDPAGDSDRWIAQYRTNLRGADLVFTYGKYWKDHVAGIDLATQLGDAGLRGEVTYTVPQSGSPYAKILLGGDYAFANTFTLSAELYGSSQSMAELQASVLRNPQLAQVQPFGNRYVGLAASYEITPLFKTGAYFLVNLSDRSRFISPTFSYSVTDNLTVSGGAQFFSGGEGSDYGRGKNLGFIQVQRHF